MLNEMTLELKKKFKINRKNQAQADFQTVLILEQRNIMKYITHSSEIRGLCLMK